MSNLLRTFNLRIVCHSLLTATALSIGAAPTVQAATATEWSALAKQPNFTEGVWGYTFSVGSTAQSGAGGSAPQLKAGYKTTTRMATGESCTPIGVPSVMSKPYPFEFVFEPDRVLMLMEFDGLVRRIWTDGRKLPEDPDLTYGGTSIGHWENDTLVVETIGLLPEVQVAPGVAADESTRITERMRLTDPNTLSIEFTITSGNALAQPWRYTRTYQRHRDWAVQEYFCQQNPRLTTDANGKDIPDLTPPR